MVRRKEIQKNQKKLNETLSRSSKVQSILKLKTKLEKQVIGFNDQIISGYADSINSDLDRDGPLK